MFKSYTPIEKCPERLKDGRRVLVFARPFYNDEWNESLAQYRPVGYLGDPTPAGWFNRNGDFLVVSHFMELPKHPKVGEKWRFTHDH